MEVVEIHDLLGDNLDRDKDELRAREDIIEEEVLDIKAHSAGVRGGDDVVEKTLARNLDFFLFGVVARIVMAT